MKVDAVRVSETPVNLYKKVLFKEYSFSKINIFIISDWVRSKLCSASYSLPFTHNSVSDCLFGSVLHMALHARLINVTQYVGHMTHVHGTHMLVLCPFLSRETRLTYIEWAVLKEGIERKY
jgi:hypothetical protein